MFHILLMIGNNQISQNTKKDQNIDSALLSEDNLKLVTKKAKTEKTKGSKDSLGRITLYAAAQLGFQFCTHIYSILSL